MSKIKNVLIFLIIVLIICIFLIIYINQKEVSVEQEIETKGNTEIQQIADEIEVREDYFTINNCIREYLNAINIENSAYYRNDQNGNYVKVVEENFIKNKIYNLLSTKFIAKNDITIKNIYDKIQIINKTALFIPLKIELINNANVRSYYVYGLVEDISNYNIIMELRAIVNLDRKNGAFSIEVLEENYKEENRVSIDNIERNENNQLYIQNINTQIVVEDYLKLYKGAVLGNPELVYNYLLDEEYKNKRFKNLEDFKKYIEKNKSLFFSARVEKYGVKSNGEYDEYLVIDQNGRYYCFKEKEIMNYKIILDTYTIDSQDFINKYDSTTEQGKVALNIDKFIKAINDKSYYYAYNLLSEGFKSNYFKTQEEFENYARETFFDNNNVDYKEGKFSVESGLYKYELTITNSEGENITKTFIMKLNDNREFEMSFNV
ncbi:MAG: hypothetical protein IJB90_03215 [Clostridia bacterium]|nr:hypothetical protein [Clostridia bacterium]